ncbi:MAG: 3-dehydroquinate synthase [Flavobacteriales bacterium]|nr:3-dehydroquinate synthase [Flavobacteriales bacterium]
MNKLQTYSLSPTILIESAKEIFTLLKKHKLTESQIFILADTQTSEHCLPLIESELPGGGRRTILLDIPSGESTKTLATAHDLYSRLMEYEADRKSLLLNVGGGMVCDLGGFVASTYKRGIQWINIPTTVLAQVDAAIGGKTGLNHHGVKNVIGTFEQPLATLVYPQFLNTLPKREVLAGFAEMIKHALIASTDLWEQMLKAPYIDLPLIKSLIGPSMVIKEEIVSRDMHETGERKKLNFGHTIGHALESYMMESPERDLLHGEAVALGIMAETYISHKKGYITESLHEQIAGFIAQHYECPPLHESNYHRILEIMKQDKKKRSSELNMTLLKGIGEAVIDRNPKMDLVIDSLTYLERYPFKG